MSSSVLADPGVGENGLKGGLDGRSGGRTLRAGLLRRRSGSQQDDDRRIKRRIVKLPVLIRNLPTFVGSIIGKSRVASNPARTRGSIQVSSYDRLRADQDLPAKIDTSAIEA